MKRLERLAYSAALGMLLFACASDKQTTAGAQAPRTVPRVQPSGAAAPVSNQQGEQFAVGDAPTSGKAAKRPKMNAQAAEAYAAGLQAFQSGDMAGAKAQFQAATQADANAYQAYYSLGVVQERLGAQGAALSSYKKATSIVPEYEPSIVGYAVLLAKTGQAGEAEGYLRRYVAKVSDSAAVFAGLAEVKSIQGDSGEAQRFAQRSLKMNPDYKPAMVTIARDHYRNRRLDLALYSLKGILDGYGEENPPRDRTNAEARMIRGLIYKEQRHRGPAMEEFRMALELRPDLVEARLHLATYLLEAGNAADAAPLLEGALRYDSDHLLARLNLGDAYRLLGKSAEAKQAFQWVLDKKPTSHRAHYNLGLLYLFSEEVPGLSRKAATKQAIKHFEKYQELRPRGATAGPDDVEELITRAKSKIAIIEAEEQMKQQQQQQAPDESSQDDSTGTMPAEI